MRLGGSDKIDKSGMHFDGDSSTQWKVALVHATIVSLFILGLLYYFTPMGSFYITASSNYFAHDLGLQAVVMLAAGIVAVATTILGGRLRCLVAKSLLL